MPDWGDLLAKLADELSANPALDAAGVFGSAVDGTRWAHSDVDLFVITSELAERWEGAYLRRAGVMIHLQTLSRTTLAKQSATNNGSPFFTALAGVHVWFDRTGDLSRAVATAQDFRSPATALRAQRELLTALDSLHGAEKSCVIGAHAGAVESLLAALAGLARARLALGGVYPPRDVWSSITGAGLTEVAEAAAVRAGATPGPLIATLWNRWRPLIATYCAPLLETIGTDGPLSLNDLDRRGLRLSERLLSELVELGHLRETTRLHPGLGLDELCYAAPQHG